MTTEVRTKYPIALALAEVFMAWATPFCDAIQMAGSLRRRICRVKDIEFVIVPSRVKDLFDSPTGEPTINAELVQLLTEGLLLPPVRPANGPRMKRFELPYEMHEKTGAVWTVGAKRSVPLELYFCDRKKFGFHTCIRTGPADFSKAAVTQRRKGGLLDDNCFCQDGSVWSTSGNGKDCEPHELYVPTEQDFFELLSCPQIEPEQREHWQQFASSTSRKRRR